MRHLAAALLAALLLCVSGAASLVGHGGATVAASVTLDDGSVFAVGAVGADAHQRAALWKFRRKGVPDAAFGPGGMVIASEPTVSRGLSVQQSADGIVHIGVHSSSGDGTWLEVHRWKGGAEAPLRVARQRPPGDWVGPSELAKRGANWVWNDASRLQAPALNLVAVPRDSPWKTGAIAFQGVTVDRASTANAEYIESIEHLGHAALNPYSEPIGSSVDSAKVTRSELAWLVTLVLVLLVGTLPLWRRRS